MDHPLYFCLYFFLRVYFVWNSCSQRFFFSVISHPFIFNFAVPWYLKFIFYRAYNWVLDFSSGLSLSFILVFSPFTFNVITIQLGLCLPSWFYSPASFTAPKLSKRPVGENWIYVLGSLWFQSVVWAHTTVKSFPRWFLSLHCLSAYSRPDSQSLSILGECPLGRKQVLISAHLGMVLPSLEFY